MSLFDDYKKPTKNSEDTCNNCICNQFRRLTTGRIVDVVLSGVEFPNLVFTCFDSKTCCVTLIDSTSPFIVECKKIEAIRLVNG